MKTQRPSIEELLEVSNLSIEDLEKVAQDQYQKTVKLKKM